jgi:hypothetical protein
LTEDEIVANKVAPMDELLESFGWPISGFPSSIRCPVHAGGQETHPSAKIYGKFDSIYCFRCNKQYKVVDVAAALWSVEPPEAAKRLLERWKPTDEQRQDAIRETYQAQHKSTVDSIFRQQVEAGLRTFKRRIPLQVYREQAASADLFLTNLIKIPEQFREFATSTFVGNLLNVCQAQSKPRTGSL